MRKIGQFITFWTALLFYPINGLTLGLGEIEVSTFLNQPLKAEIEVVSARPGEVDDLLVSLASREAFRKAGLERPADLSKLRFKVEKSEDGQSARILITTKTPVKEPFLNFLVEADWAKGRLLREFTILLDPPYFAQQPAAPAVSTPSPAPVEPATQSTPVAPQPQPIAEIISPESEQAQPEDSSTGTPIALSDEPPSQDSSPFAVETVSSGGSGGDDAITVGKGDTLWGIASQFQDGDHSMAQIMLAMQSMNPDAFGDDNINNLKVGAVLRAPDPEALNRLSRQEAYAEVLEQNGLWDDYVARKTGVTTSGSPMDAGMDGAMPAPAEESDSQLTLLAPGDGESTSASQQQGEATSENAGQIRKQLALAEEELEAARLENEDLKSRISDLEQQIGKFEELQRLVQIEDSGLAQLQDSVSESGAESESIQGESPTEQMDEISAQQPSAESELPAGDELAAQADEILDDQSTTGGEQALMSDDMMSDAGTVAGRDEMLADDSGTVAPPSSEMGPALDQTSTGQTDLSDSRMDQSMPVEQEDSQQNATVVPPPVIVTEVPGAGQDDGILGMLPSFDSLLSDPIMLGGIGSIIVLLIGMVLYKRKKAAEEEEMAALLEEGLDDDLVDDDATPIHVPSGDEIEPALEESVALADTAVMDADESPDELLQPEQDEFTSTEIISAAELPEQDDSRALEQDDVLNEVDVYLAYGLYDNAEELLKENLQNSPDRADYRAKLLDTYFATKNRDSFVKEAQALKSLGGAADRYWERVKIMGYELDPDNDLFAGAEESGLSAADLEYAKPDSADFDIGAEGQSDDFAASTDIDFGIDEDDDFDTLATREVTPQGAATGEITDTMTVAPPGSEEDDLSAPLLGEDDETMLRAGEGPAIDKLDLPDEIGEFDLDLDDSEVALESDSPDDDEDALNFDLPDDLDLAVDSDDTELAPDRTQRSDDDENVLPPMADEGLDIEATDNIEVDFDSIRKEQDELELVDLEQSLDTGEARPKEDDSSDDLDVALNSAELDMDMSDLDSAELRTGNFSPAVDQTRDDITEFKPADMTDEFTGVNEAVVEVDEPLEEIDSGAGLEKTGTFAPGDFNDDEIADALDDFGSGDDIEDLMLPDDVDEVGTKLDLAKAFIDMGDAEGARSSLEEVLSEGTDEQRAEANELLAKIS